MKNPFRPRCVSTSLFIALIVLAVLALPSPASGEGPGQSDRGIDGSASRRTAPRCAPENGEGGGCDASEVRVVALQGRNGRDRIVNLDDLVASANATAQADSDNARATAIGILAGNGPDLVVNSGTIDASATASLTGAGEAESVAIGIDAGNGKDGVFTEGGAEGEALAPDIVVDAATTVTVSDAAWDLVGSESEAGVDASATAVGISGGNGKDGIVNEGTMAVSATTGVSVTNVAVTLIDAEHPDAAIAGIASATGLDGGNGKDGIANSGDFSVSAEATVTTGSVAITGIMVPWPIDAALDGSTLASSSATGMRSGNGKDEAFVSNEAIVTVEADAEAVADSLSVTLLDFLSYADTSVSAEAGAAGIEGGNGKDAILNSGTLDVDAEASATSRSLTVDLVGLGATRSSLSATAAATGIEAGNGSDEVANSGAITADARADMFNASADLRGAGVGLTDFSLSASATATGIEGGSGSDALVNSGSVDATASADAQAYGLTFALVDLTPVTDLEPIEEAIDFENDGSTNAVAAAAGLSGGSSDDELDNTGTVSATAEATALAVGVELSSEGLPDMTLDISKLGTLENLVDASVSADATAVALDGGEGRDLISNSGTATAAADAATLGSSISVGFPTIDVPVLSTSPSVSVGEAGAKATARAAAISGGEGSDVILNEGDAVAGADAKVLEAAVSLSIEGGSDGSAAAACRLNALAVATAEATGIDSGEGDDLIVSTGNVIANATTEAESISANVVIQGKTGPKGKLGFDIQGTMADAGSIADATATGISGGAGRDVIGASGAVSSTATATNLGVGLSAEVISDAEKGIVTGATAVRASTVAEASAAGIDSGEGSDLVRSSASIDATATATAVSASASLVVQGAKSKASGLGASLADASSSAGASATGIDSGDGSDLVWNEGDIHATASANAVAVSVSADLAPSSGAMLGLALANARNAASAAATGIAGGSDDDAIFNSGTLTAVSDALGVAGSVSVTRNGASASGTLDPASFDAGNLAVALAKGIDGGEGDERIDNSGSIHADASAVTAAAAVSADAKGIALAMASAASEAEASGIDSGNGNHWITNSGAIDADAVAIGAAANVAVSGEGLAAGVDTVWDRGTRADSDAAAIRTGDGLDLVNNAGALAAEATAVSASAAVAVVGKGVSAALSTSSADAQATGISTGAGCDAITNSGSIQADALASANALGVAVSGKGISGSGNDLWDGGVEAAATATGIDAGSGSNLIVNSGSVAADARAITAGASVAVTGTGLSAAVSTATASADATGIDSGSGIGLVLNSGTITADASSTAVLANVAVTVTGVSGASGSVWDGGTTSSADATGIATGSYGDLVKGSGAVSATADAVTVSASVAVTGTGVAVAATTATTEAAATGIATGDGDDRIEWDGDIEADSDATGVAASVAVTGIGISASFDAVWDGGTKTTARTAGIAGGSGNDTIGFSGSLAARSEADSAAITAALTAKGVAAASTSSTTLAEAVGIDAGSGDDLVTASGSIIVDADAEGTSVSTALTIVGVSATIDAPSSVWEGGTNATANSDGISAGDGYDRVSNSATISASARSKTTSVEVTATLGGITAGGASSTSTASSTGIDLGDGGGFLDNTGEITVTTIAEAQTVSVSVVGVGATGIENEIRDWAQDTLANASATGISGGGGSDILTNSSRVTVTASADTDATTAKVVLLGYGNSRADGAASAAATGIDSGAGADSVTNEASIDVTATATAGANGVTVTVAGAGKANMKAGAAAVSTGIAAGSGDDTVVNSGDISSGTWSDDPLAAMAAVNIQGSTWILAGAGSSGAAAQASADSVGIDSGDGDDAIGNTGSVGAWATARADTKQSSYTFAGASGSSGTIGATADSAGISGGAGNDKVRNAGAVTARSRAIAESSGSAATFAGGSDVYASADATASAVGIDSGEGDDKVGNTGAIEVEAEAGTVVDTGSKAFAGELVAYSVTKLSAGATGIDTGDGADLVWNGASIGVQALATGSAKASADSDFLSNASDASAASVATASGVSSSGGDDRVVNAAGASVDVSAESISVADAWSDEDSTALSLDNAAEAAGMDAGDGANEMGNLGSITATAAADIRALATSSSTQYHANSTAKTSAQVDAWGLRSGAGDDHLWNGDETPGSPATITATATASAASNAVYKAPHTDDATAWSDLEVAATGVHAGEGDNRVENHGTITSSATAAVTTKAKTDTDTTITHSTAEGYADAAATGIGAGAGNDTIVNMTGAAVSAAATASAKPNAPDDWNAWADENSVSTSDADAVSRCIDAGDGENDVTNFGSIGASATAGAVARSGAEAVVNSTYAEANARADALAVGVASGTGGLELANSGTITADASASSSAEAHADTGIFGSDQRREIAVASSTAVGVDAAGGNNLIVNLKGGSIVARASAATNRAAYGIRTGAGDDLIENYGNIEAWTRASSGHAWEAGIGIDSGAGNDKVTLGDGSFVTGDILLGAGNDTLNVVGTGNLSGIAWGGAGTDLLEIEGEGSFSAAQTREFENFLKYGAGMLTLEGASVFESLEVASGSLRVEGGLALTDGSRLAAWVYGDGTNGLISVGGELALDGTLAVARGTGAFRDGTSFDIIEADSLSGAFAFLELPAPTELLSFSLVPGGATGYRVVASAAEFTSVASTADERAIASVFDALLPAATGDLSLVLGEFQSLASADYDAAFDSLGPGAYGASSVASLSAIDGFSGAIFSRLSALEPSGASTGPTLGRATIKRLGHAGPSGASSGARAKAEHGFWLSGFGQWGGYSPDDGGFLFSVSGTAVGWDAAFRDGLSAGLGAGYSGTGTALASGAGRTDSMTGSAYGAWVQGVFRLDGALALSRQVHSLTREIEVGTIDRVASSTHEGDSINATFGANLAFGAGPLTVSPGLHARYVFVAEEAFTETGADSVSLAVAGRSDHSLCSDLGLALALELVSGPLGLSADLSALWRHDFLYGSAPIEAAFADAPEEPFLTQAPGQTADGILIGAGLLVKTGAGFSVSLRYDCELRGGFFSNGLSAAARYGF
ncbi:MAG: autotransporter outer membrane beta-barrel domain-containing protein [Spirochaetales bacterium]|nr:autotransporter outer membrane beta-barrel domain-containing protein [Spirochaetales bacterium]